MSNINRGVMHWGKAVAAVSFPAFPLLGDYLQLDRFVVKKLWHVVESIYA
jgi:hypothetical protein